MMTYEQRIDSYAATAPKVINSQTWGKTYFGVMPVINFCASKGLKPATDSHHGRNRAITAFFDAVKRAAAVLSEADMVELEAMTIDEIEAFMAAYETDTALGAEDYY